MPAFSLAQLAKITGAELHGDGDCMVQGVGSLDDAKTGEVTFLSSSKFRRHLESTRASAVILKPADLARCPVDALVSDNPYLAYARAASALYAEEEQPVGVHTSAVVEDSAQISARARIEAQCYIGEDVQIADDVVIGPGCVILNRCRIGQGTRLVANVTLGSDTQLGERCLVQPGAVIGADGFGMANDQGRWVKVPQLGCVVIGNDVEVGASTTVDRGALKDTVIEDGVKLDNQIQVAHNVHIGAHTAIAAGVGIAGSTKIGAYCTLAGHAGVAGHVELVDHTHVSGLTAITKSIREPGVYTSTVPAVPHEQWRRNFTRLKQLDDMARRLQALEKAMQEQQSDQS